MRPSAGNGTVFDKLAYIVEHNPSMVQELDILFDVMVEKLRDTKGGA